MSHEDSDDGDIYFTLCLDTTLLVAIDDLLMHDWILDSGASFHVTHREWFTTYDASCKG